MLNYITDFKQWLFFKTFKIAVFLNNVNWVGAVIRVFILLFSENLLRDYYDYNRNSNHITIIITISIIKIISINSFMVKFIMSYIYIYIFTCKYTFYTVCLIVICLNKVLLFSKNNLYSNIIIMFKKYDSYIKTYIAFWKKNV